MLTCNIFRFSQRWSWGPCSPLKIDRHFEGKYRLLLQIPRISQIIYQLESMRQAELCFIFKGFNGVTSRVSSQHVGPMALEARTIVNGSESSGLRGGQAIGVPWPWAVSWSKGYNSTWRGWNRCQQWILDAAPRYASVSHVTCLGLSWCSQTLVQIGESFNVVRWLMDYGKLKQWIVCTPLSVNVFVTLATQ
jgi:hypothetical protein